MEFLAKVEDQAKLTRANKQRTTEDDLIRMSLIAGFWERNLEEKALVGEGNPRITKDNLIRMSLVTGFWKRT